MSKIGKIAIVVALVAAVAIVIILKQGGPSPATDQPAPGKGAVGASPPAAGLPRLVDLGSDVCIPCKLMAPILEGLKTEFAGRLQVDFIDVNKDPAAGKPYAIRLIPTQIFFDGAGKELFRHEGFFSREDILGKWKAMGFDFEGGEMTGIVREEPVAADSRPAGSVCALCDDWIDTKTAVTVAAPGGEVALCSPHCFFIYYSSLRDPKSAEGKVAVTDDASGKTLPAADASYLYGKDEQGRPTIRAFADRDAAAKEQKATGGEVVAWPALQEKELAVLCGFCDRAVYPADACGVKVDGKATVGCCPMCALGVAARTKKDIEVEAKDALTGDAVRVKTAGGTVAALEPATAVAWHGQKKGPDGKMVSAGCFKQFVFASEVNLRQWLDEHPEAAGRMQTIADALAAKMNLTAEQIAGACKIGECAPK